MQAPEDVTTLAIKQLPPEVMNPLMTVLGWVFWLGLIVFIAVLMWVASLWWLEKYGDRERPAGQRTEMRIVQVLLGAIIMSCSSQIATSILGS